jgi:hypothetical protein
MWYKKCKKVRIFLFDFFLEKWKEKEEELGMVCQMMWSICLKNLKQAVKSEFNYHFSLCSGPNFPLINEIQHVKYLIEMKGNDRIN